ncbi:glycosyltransferase WbsX family protein [Sphingobacterium corticibacter]|uniref:Lipopolysaccharide biosynthesis protein n=1 Tax=Sphingobacterium corticibacter TaxID=2171749 RepID=A0A2T8HJR1_9SPHI|nr:glycoside hydrolase family 99-like domain-containing protein [Sphingobacterium corticibacter]PVH25610.1 lipopolysaccharide biosynthesis protein [Sphingobacterium corticibacter]
MGKDENTKIIAYYLPQFHPFPENDEWWGKGFTEWTNVGKAKSLFRGHYQPRVPADLGYYDLRVPEVRKEQTDLARMHGIDAFCYWHYWFGNGKRLMERPFEEMVKSGEPDFPFCLGWANESWKGFAHGLKNRNTLIEQLYPGEEDVRNHFYALLEAFKDKRYLRIDGKIAFVIYRPLGDESIPDFITTWRQLAKENDLNDFYFIGHINSPESNYQDVLASGVDAVNTVRIADIYKKRSLGSKIFNKLNRIFFNQPNRFNFSKVAPYFFNKEIDMNERVYPSIITGWDHTPRSGREGLVLDEFTPESFKTHVSNVMSNVSRKKNRIIFIKSWNEWAEGNYLEPDLRYGHAFLEVIRKVKDKTLFHNK